jgi:hypothetical protein
MDINIRLTIGLSDELASFIRSVIPTGTPPVREKTAEEREAISRPIETAGAPSAAAEPDTSASVTDASTASPAPKGRSGRKAQSAPPSAGEPVADDPFTPAATAAAPAASAEASSASDAAETTKQDVLDAMSKWLDRDGHTPLQLKTEFETRFKQADGTPAASAGKLQPKDYAAAVAFLKA